MIIKLLDKDFDTELNEFLSDKIKSDSHFKLLIDLKLNPSNNGFNINSLEIGEPVLKKKITPQVIVDVNKSKLKNKVF